MKNIVIKLDCTSLSTPENIDLVSKQIIEEKKRGRNVVVVVPQIKFMNETIRAFTYSLSDKPSTRELNLLYATNGQIASSFVSIAIQKKGFRSITLAPWQIGLEVEEVNEKVRIENVDGQAIIEHFKKGEIVVIPGTQGINEQREMLDLGEGAADTTAVAIGVAIEAIQVDYYTNQDGIYTANPTIIQNARKLKQISYDEMLELDIETRVVHPRAVELAKKFELPIVVKSSTESSRGTLIKGEVEMEKNLIVRGVAYETDIVRLTVGYDSYENASLAEIFTTLANHEINVDIIVQAVIDKVKPTVSFSITKEQLSKAINVLEQHKEKLGFSFADFEVGLAKVSIVGSGMITNPGVAARMFDRLRKEAIAVRMVSTSEIKVSVVVPQDDMIRAATALHEEFNLIEEYV